MSRSVFQSPRLKSFALPACGVLMLSLVGLAFPSTVEAREGRRSSAMEVRARAAPEFERSARDERRRKGQVRRDARNERRHDRADRRERRNDRRDDRFDRRERRHDRRHDRFDRRERRDDRRHGRWAVRHDRRHDHWARRLDRRYHRPDRYRRGYGWRAGVFVVPSAMFGARLTHYGEYYYDDVWYGPHGHNHSVYLFPVVDRYGVTYRPHVYCGGRHYRRGYLSWNGPRFSIVLDF
jgi:hypothetical protein